MSLISVFEPAPCGLDGDRLPETIGGATVKENFLVPRGMAAPSGSPRGLPRGVGVRQGKKV